MSRLVIGVDPGISGAIVSLNFDTGGLFDTHLMPRDEAGLDRDALIGLFADYERHDIVMAGIERVHGRPGNGVKAAFRFGRYTEMLIMCMHFYGIKYTEITPKVWQERLDPPAFDGSLTQRERSKQLKQHWTSKALEKWPSLDVHRVKDQGKADAALLAAFIRENSDYWPQ